MSRKVDIVICGGGLVGLMFANLLAQSRFHLVVLDAGAAPTSVKLESPVQSGADLESGYEPRVSALNAGSMALLERCGVFSELGRHACFREMLVRDSEGAGDICFSSEDLGLPNLGMVIENHLVIEALHSRLVQFDNVDLCYGESFADVTKDDVLEVELSSGDILQCDLLVGADGGNSKVRELSGLKTVGWSYDQTAVVTTIQTEQSHDSIPGNGLRQMGH
jgi:2-octaprenylphenol hydroxylase